MIQRLRGLLIVVVLAAGRAVDEAVDTIQARVERLRRDPERGGGREPLMEVLLALGGIAAAGLVIGLLAAAINNAGSKIK